MHRKPSHESAHGERQATCTDSACSPCAAGAARRCPCPMPGSALCARPTCRAWRRRRWQTSQTSGPKAFATIIGQRIEIAARGFTEAIPSTASFSQADLSSLLVTGRRTVLKNPRSNPAICHVRTQSRANNLNIAAFAILFRWAFALSVSPFSKDTAKEQSSQSSPRDAPTPRSSC